ncbi:hypothetical protein [Zoogloea sp.]|nr:hypothetical protein [Zoogloea sp.]MCK6395690.1 hypothetical protein [Zoogloea sp.]
MSVIKVTPSPIRIIPKGLLTESARAWVVTSKYMDGLSRLVGGFAGR